jgi:hypothetical protein
MPLSVSFDLIIAILPAEKLQLLSREYCISTHSTNSNADNCSQNNVDCFAKIPYDNTGANL